MTPIKPTVGRVLHFFPTAQYMAGRKLAFGDPSQPLAAVIAYVHSDTMVNLTVWDQNSLQFDVCSVPLVQEGARSGGSFYAAWMDYQKGQAAYAESLKAGDVGKLGCADSAIEQEIQAKGLTAPRVSLADINANIASEHYFTAADGARMSSHGNHPIHNLNTGSLGLLTFCVLVLRNGFTVTGESACASPENFDAEIGRKISRENAVEKIWPLMGYELRSRLHEASRTCTCGPNEGCTRCHVGMSGD
tara:strand:+ start:24805 stop:25545 length:741 start_codon:yes stop_codon:yes gene_type:complete